MEFWIGRCFFEFSFRHPHWFYVGLFGSCGDVYLARMFQWIFDAWLTFKYAGMKQFSIGVMVLGFRLGFQFYYGTKRKKV